jgi:hypothetical protein
VKLLVTTKTNKPDVQIQRLVRRPADAQELAEPCSVSCTPYRLASTCASRMGMPVVRIRERVRRETVPATFLQRGVLPCHTRPRRGGDWAEAGVHGDSASQRDASELTWLGPQVARRGVRSSPFFEGVCRQGRESSIIDRSAHREVVQALPVSGRDAEHVVHRVIEITTDARGANARLFGLEVQDLSDEPPSWLHFASARATGVLMRRACSHGGDRRAQERQRRGLRIGGRVERAAPSPA